MIITEKYEKKLLDVIKKYNLPIFTLYINVDSSSIPHAFPVLTIPDSSLEKLILYYLYGQFLHYVHRNDNNDTFLFNHCIKLNNTERDKLIGNLNKNANTSAFISAFNTFIHMDRIFPNMRDKCIELYKEFNIWQSNTNIHMHILYDYFKYFSGDYQKIYDILKENDLIYVEKYLIYDIRCDGSGDLLVNLYKKMNEQLLTSQNNIPINDNKIMAIILKDEIRTGYHKITYTQNDKVTKKKSLNDKISDFLYSSLQYPFYFTVNEITGELLTIEISVDTDSDNISDEIKQNALNSLINTFDTMQKYRNLIVSQNFIGNLYYILDNDEHPYIVTVSNSISIYYNSKNLNDLAIINKIYEIASYKHIFFGDDPDIWKSSERLPYNVYGNTILVQLSDFKYIYIGEYIAIVTTDEIIEKYYSPIGEYNSPNPYAESKTYYYDFTIFRKIINKESINNFSNVLKNDKKFANISYKRDLIDLLTILITEKKYKKYIIDTKDLKMNIIIDEC